MLVARQGGAQTPGGSLYSSPPLDHRLNAFIARSFGAADFEVLLVQLSKFAQAELVVVSRPKVPG